LLDFETLEGVQLFNYYVYQTTPYDLGYKID